ncbi:hypothetical protein M885DRAFT_142708 [Pelagophyceae sp. CCMP2097]|nr:hypothetical protein M885DRAFT_142708 [Pelagophyceae sp. CCMP2097]
MANRGAGGPRCARRPCERQRRPAPRIRDWQKPCAPKPFCGSNPLEFDSSRVWRLSRAPWRGGCEAGPGGGLWRRRGARHEGPARGARLMGRREGRSPRPARGARLGRGGGRSVSRPLAGLERARLLGLYFKTIKVGPAETTNKAHPPSTARPKKRARS